MRDFDAGLLRAVLDSGPYVHHEEDHPDQQGETQYQDRHDQSWRNPKVFRLHRGNRSEFSPPLYALTFRERGENRG